MTIHGFLRCLKLSVFSVNFLLWVTGMCIFGLAVYLRVTPSTNNMIQASYGGRASTYHVICYVLIGTGAMMTFVGFLGCCGAFQESRCMIGTFFVCLLLIFTAEVVGGTLGFIHRKELKENIASSFKNFIQKDYGKPGIDNYPIDYVQEKLKCCGSEAPMDWHWSNWHDTPNTHRTNRVPLSCCMNPQSKQASHGACTVAGAWVDGVKPGVWSEGCSSKLAKLIAEKTMLLVSVGMAVAGLQVVSLILALLLCCGFKQESSGGYKA